MKTPRTVGISASLLVLSMIATGGVAAQAPPSASSPDRGSLGLDELIQYALQHNVELAELRGELSIALAEERASKDWEDPEIRASFRRDNDVELPPTEKETRTVTQNRSGSGSESEKESRTDKDGGKTDKESRSSSSSEKFNSTSQTRSTRTVQRGARSERITEETWESSSESQSGSSKSKIVEQKSGGKSDTVRRSESFSSNSNETLTDRTIEDRQFNSDITTPDEDFNIKLRLRVPNPFERKARIAKARAKIGLATAMLNSAEHEVALAVRKSYADAVAAQAKLAGGRSLSGVHSKLADEIGNMGAYGKLEDEIAAQSDSFRSSLELPILEMELERELSQLANLVGLADPRRIHLGSRIAPTRVNLSGLDRDYLYQVAEGYRGDILSLIHRLKVSEYDMAEYNAKKVPWFTFVEGFYGVEHDQGYRSSDNYGFQVGVTLPLFTWFKNKGHEVIEQEQNSLSTQAGIVRNRIRAEIDAAVTQVERASVLLQRFKSRRARYKASMNEFLAQAKKGGIQSNDARFRAEEALARLDELEPELEKGYNEAILMLEHAVGTSLDEVFSVESSAAAANDGSPQQTEAGSPQTSTSSIDSDPGTAGKKVKRGARKPPHRRR